MKIDTTLAMGPMDKVGKVARSAEEMGFSGIFTAAGDLSQVAPHGIVVFATSTRTPAMPSMPGA